MENLFLIKPSVKYKEQILNFKKELLDNNEQFDGCVGLKDVTSYEEWIDFERRLVEMYGKKHAKSEVYLAIRESDDRLVGIADYRHPITGFLLEYGGNIGYTIRPSERKKGYGTELLRLLVPICKEFGENRILLTCDKINEASQRVILNNNGVMENEVTDTVNLSKSGTIKRYWISV